MSIKVLTDGIQTDPLLRDLHNLYRRFPEVDTSNSNVYIGGHTGVTGAAGATGAIACGYNLYADSMAMIAGHGNTGVAHNVLYGHYINSQNANCVVVGNGPRTSVPVAGSILLGHACERPPDGATGATGAYFCLGSQLEAPTAANSEVVSHMIPVVYNGVLYQLHSSIGGPLP